MVDAESGHRRGSMIDASSPVGRHLRERPGRADVSIPWSSPTVRVVLASTLLAPLGIALISPGLPVIQERFGLTDAGTSLIISSYFMTGIVLSPLIGLLEDRIGRRPVLVPCLVGFSLTGAAIAVAPTYGVAIGLRILQGTAAAGIFITTVTLIGDSFDGGQRRAVFGANTAVLSGAAALFPILGGYLATLGWNVPFLAYLLGLPVALFATLALEEPDVEHSGRGLDSLRRVVTSLSPRESALLYGSAFTIEVLLFGAVFTAIPFLLSDAYRASPVVIGFVVTGALASSAVAAAGTGRLTRYLSDESLIVLGFASAGAGLLVAWLAGSTTTIGLASVVFGAGWGITLPSIDDEVSEFVPAELRAEALSLRNSATFLGRALAPVLVATLAVAWSYPVILLAAGLAGFAAGLVGLVLSRYPTDEPN